MIDLSRQFIFIHIPKCAGCSIINALPEKTTSSNVINCGHCSLDEVLRLNPKFKHFFKFTFVRNPWSRVVSSYCFWKNQSNNCDFNFSQWDEKQINFCQNHSFEEFVLNLDSEELNKPHVQPYFEKHIKDQNFNYIGKVESIQKDFDYICDAINIKRLKLKHKNKSTDKNYQTYYTSKTKDIVYKKFLHDIKYFDYEF